MVFLLFLLYVYEMMDANYTYCSSHFTKCKSYHYVVTLYSDICQVYLSKLRGGEKPKNSQGASVYSLSHIMSLLGSEHSGGSHLTFKSWPFSASLSSPQPLSTPHASSNIPGTTLPQDLLHLMFPLSV